MKGYQRLEQIEADARTGMRFFWLCIIGIILAIIFGAASALAETPLTKEARLKAIIIEAQSLNDELKSELATTAATLVSFQMALVDLTFHANELAKATAVLAAEIPKVQRIADTYRSQRDEYKAGEARAWKWWRWSVGYAASVTVALALCVYLLFKP